jgi:hypothetical protein
MKASNKKLIPKNIRNKHSKSFRTLLKNKRIKRITAKMLWLS